MKFPVYGGQSLMIDVRVDLRCGDIGMAQHFLDGTERGPVGKKVAGKAMAEGMG